MLYGKNNTSALSDELFRSPTCEYRGMPFWAWNCALEEKELLWQIEVFKKMGFGGFFMHSRAGLDTEYLGDEFMEIVQSCVEKAKTEKMLAGLYDEDRYPSGSAGGIVTKEEKYRKRYLVFSPEPPPQERVILDFGMFDIVLDDGRSLKAYKRICSKEEAVGEIWYAYEEMAESRNGQTYVDTMNPEAIGKFIEVTYDAYSQKVGSEFGKAVPAIFTDEPAVAFKTRLKASSAKEKLIFSWTDDFEDTYTAAYGESLLAKLPELVWNLPDLSPSLSRYRYFDHADNRFQTAYMAQIYDWCQKNGIAFTGHVMGEYILDVQSAMYEAMPAYKNMTIPGVDILYSLHQFNTLKQCQSAVRQYGKEAMVSELYGISSWDYDFRDYKMSGDWQAAMGVTIRVPHLSMVSMEGVAKRDFPPSINYQSPWYEKFSLVEDHFARLNTALTRGKPIVHVGIIHPMESYWLRWGPKEQNDDACKKLDKNFEDINTWLTLHCLDFDYISEKLFPELCPNGGFPLNVGEMAYDVIIVPGCETLRGTTVERLSAFAQAGGKLVFMGEEPAYMDALPSDVPAALYHKSTVIPFSCSALLSTLEEVREVEVREKNNTISQDMLYQMRQDGADRWLFICRGQDPEDKDAAECRSLTIKIKGKWDVRLYDTLCGDIRPLTAEIKDNTTYLSVDQYNYDSFLFRLTPADEVSKDNAEVPVIEQAVAPVSLEIPSGVPFTLWEPNALLLDIAEYALDDEPYRPQEELLRIDTYLREELGLPKRGLGCVRWRLPKAPAEHRVRLRFRISSEIDLQDAMLAMEHPEMAEIFWNGEKVSCEICGFYVDHCIKTVRIPDICAGENILELILPFSVRHCVERCYILGSFGIKVEDSEKTIVPLADTLDFGDIVPQTLAFYSGKLDYHLDIEVPAECSGEELQLYIAKYRGSLIQVLMDDEERGEILYPPYTCSLGKMETGRHRITLRLYVPRTNGFGPVHYCAPWKCIYYESGVWQSKDKWFTYGYSLSDQGILAKPELTCVK
ncbi:MAG: hypothetical protein IJ325_00175 [Clostridia bacterium]|nr:hypothetical protein [Clostridia bacterium]